MSARCHGSRSIRRSANSSSGGQSRAIPSLRPASTIVNRISGEGSKRASRATCSQHAAVGLVGVVQQHHRLKLLIAVLDQPVADRPPKPGRGRRRLGVQSPLVGQHPQHLGRLDANRLSLATGAAVAAELIGEDLQQQRLAAARRSDQQPQPAMLLDQEVQPGQGLLVRGALVEGLRIKAAPERGLAQTPVCLVHRFRPPTGIVSPVYPFFSVQSARKLERAVSYQLSADQLSATALGR